MRYLYTIELRVSPNGGGKLNDFQTEQAVKLTRLFARSFRNNMTNAVHNCEVEVVAHSHDNYTGHHDLMAVAPFKDSEFARTTG